MRVLSRGYQGIALGYDLGYDDTIYQAEVSNPEKTGSEKRKGAALTPAWSSRDGEDGAGKKNRGAAVGWAPGKTAALEHWAR